MEKLEDDISEFKPCIICGERTRAIFGIKLKQVPICWKCEKIIVLQSISFEYGD